MTKEEFLKLYIEHSEASEIQENVIVGSEEGELVQVLLKSDDKLFQANCDKSFKDGTDNPNNYSITNNPVEVVKNIMMLPVYTSKKSESKYSNYVALVNNGETVVGVFPSEELAGKWIFDNVLKAKFKITEKDLEADADEGDDVTPENAWEFYDDCGASVREIEIV